MSTEYQGSTDEARRSHGPEKGQGKRKRRKGYIPQQRNDLYRIAQEFKRRHPKATAADAWTHFAGLAGLGGVVVSYSAATDSIEYVPDSERWGTRKIRRVSFERHYRKVSGV